MCLLKKLYCCSSFTIRNNNGLAFPTHFFAHIFDAGPKKAYCHEEAYNNSNR